MITVTTEARSLFDSVVRPEGLSLRLDVVDNEGHEGQPRVNLVAGEPARRDDQVVLLGGAEVLRIGKEVSDALDGCVVRRIEMPEVVGFTIVPGEGGEYVEDPDRL
jgi:hypothetical protein